MRIGRAPGSLPPAQDVASALLRAAGALGHRPAATVVRPDRRDEQGFASLLKWTAKGAHLLEAEALLAPGDRLRLDAPAGWPALAVCLAAWWAGVVVTTEGDADLVVVHEAGEGDYAVGEAFDGAPLAPTAVEPWPVAVQTFPDQPPPPRAEPDAPALRTGPVAWTQRELLAAAAGAPAEVGADDPPQRWVPALVRPLVTGEPTTVRAR